MPRDPFASRRRKLLRRLATERVDALLVISPANVRYLTGFTGEDSILIIGRTATVLVSDSRFEIQIAQECPGLDAHIRSRTTSLTDAAASVVSRAKLRTLAFEGQAITFAQWEAISTAAKPTQLTPACGYVEALRIIKEPDEVRAIRQAIAQAERGFRVLRASVRPEMTELEGAFELENAMRRFGAQGPSFETIVAAGARAALPHGRPTSARIGDGELLLVDWGATNSQGYRSDLTRLLTTGTISPKLEKLYGVVLNAQRRAIESIRPGILASEVDAAARQVIAQAGYARNFGHGLGHGIGLEIHEGPRVSPNSKTALEAGMVVTVEPGVYLPGWGGIRIEDDVLVTPSGHEVLTSLQPELADSAIGW